MFTCTKVDDLAGKLNILLEAEETAALTACKTTVDSTNYASADKAGLYVYDVEIYKGTPEVVYRAIQGINSRKSFWRTPRNVRQKLLSPAILPANPERES